MTANRLFTVAWMVLCLSASVTDANDPSQAIADRIDLEVEKLLATEDVQPAPMADDAEFARRVYLDIVGRIPSVGEIRLFLADDAPDKRTRLIDRLLENPLYVSHFVQVWRNLLLPEASTNAQLQAQVPSFDAWLRGHLSRNSGYDEMVRELLAVPVDEMVRQPSPSIFFAAKQAMPENLAASTSRLFLGIRLECAQCHDHPFDRWTQEEFWSFAAFFAGIEPVSRNDPFGGAREVADRRELAIPDSILFVQARYLDGTTPPWLYDVSPRQQLVQWLTSKENVQFAKAGVNRIWAQFFGHGLVDPVDDLSRDNPASHPELFDFLADKFRTHDYDVKLFIRAIARSKTYQRSSRLTHPSQDDVRLLARMAVRGLTGAQLFDSLALATGFQEATSTIPNSVVANGPRSEFLEFFADLPSRTTDAQSSILQALLFMNGNFINNSVSAKTGDLLTAVMEAPFLSTDQRIDTLYLATLSRFPSANERERMQQYLAVRQELEALADLFWALLNSSEFTTNH